MSDKKENTINTRDIKKVVAYSKIIFVLGGPASGKGTQCERMVEEFGYTHISTGDLMRKEMESGSKEGDRIKKIVSDGGLVPFELTVQLLCNAIVATPSSAYLIDGFPRAVDQAQYFEQNVCEAQTVLFYDVPQEIMLERCMKRAQNSNRSDDNPETLKKRVQNYFDQSYPVIEYYQRFGKVHKINATVGVSEVYEHTKNAIIPQTYFVVGPKASGKSTIAKNLASRTNMVHIDFDQWTEENGLEEQDDETVCLKLIQQLARQIKPRVILENFPKNLFQAKIFIRNGKKPQNVFKIRCSKVICQERIDQLKENDEGYVPSVILARKAHLYNEQSETLMPYLKKQTNWLEVNTELIFEQTMEQVNKVIEPLCIHIRPGANSNNLRKEITEKLSEKHGFINLDVNSLIRDENERKTAIGQEMASMVQQNKIIPGEMIVRMIQKIIYSGIPSRDKFILTSFPDVIDQAKEFEQNCAKIMTIIYSTADDNVIEIKNNNLSLFNIDSLFQKEFRLRTMTHWDWQEFQEKLGNKIDYVLFLGRTCTGKTELSQFVAKKLGYYYINMFDIKKKLVSAKQGDQEDAPEGEIQVSDKEIEEETIRIMRNNAKKGEQRTKFVFDGLLYKDCEEIKRFTKLIGVPESVFNLAIDKKTLKPRLLKKLEIEAISEELKAEMKQQKEMDIANRQILSMYFSQFLNRCTYEDLDGGLSLETLQSYLISHFIPKVILINHEKRLGIDTTCSNLALKYNMLYLSIYQLIKFNIESNTKIGIRLVQTKRSKELNLTSQVRDEFNEAEFSPALYDLQLVMELIKNTIEEKRTNQKFIIIEGMCNSGKFVHEIDRLELRFMDEFLAIEKNIGDIQACIGLQFAYDQEYIDEKDIEYENIQAPQVAEVKHQVEDGEENPVENVIKKVAKFEAWQYKWTKTDKQQKNLPQLFLALKGQQDSLHEVKTAEQFSSSQYEAISRSLDEFCARVTTDKNYIYQQVVFTE